MGISFVQMLCYDKGVASELKAKFRNGFDQEP